MNEFTRTRITRQIRIMSAHAIAHRDRGEDVAAARAQAWADAAKEQRDQYGDAFRRRHVDHGPRPSFWGRRAHRSAGESMHGELVG